MFEMPIASETFFVQPQGNSIPAFNSQVHFPVRPGPNQPPENQLNQQFANTCFRHLADGALKRSLLTRVLSSDAWAYQARVPDVELSHFGTKHGSRDYECCFCATRPFTSLAGVINCIKGHILL
ncbi:hypothetical protein M408DRAFT_157031 [Serendipita vermifera MAFF 305830]|uniref:Uncharacterized protein n=1 Tax=Serendipita vermifera MAFF 305830 TaxID=933852 RepID=A0A0C2XXI5_SERVB|nr:hypothetical protein M408DRAFT_157031 [Serendipita vermifera MAFF 305830]